ncbi:MAG: transketolase [Gammaproteobacteria bacterium]|nr:transketolase [Gammaproteobacteria bacterium]
MRNAFADELTQLAKQNNKVVLLSGDIGNKLFDKFKNVDETRFYNCGVAEANMMGVAAGMALSGLRPVVYTITPFTTTRCFEQIRVDACYHKAPVIIVGTGAGLSYAELGPTHHSLEDIAILRTLPRMRVLAPCDATELRLALRAALHEDGPVYIRIGKKGEPPIHAKTPNFKIGKAIVVRTGTDVALISTGTIMPEALRAAELLAERGISAEVISFHSVKPLDQEYLEQACARFQLLATVEEHGRIGGLGSAISEWRTARQTTPMQISFGTDDEFMYEVGSQDYARQKYGLTASNIANKVLTALNKL